MNAHTAAPMQGTARETGDEASAVERLRSMVRRLPEANTADARMVETHISLLLLSGAHAWKFKKPVRMPFADFTDAAERKRLCHAEVRLNRRLAPALYLGVSRVTGTPHKPRLGGRGASLEHAVHMRRFAPDDEAGRALREGRIASGHLHRLGEDVAAFHANAEVLAPGRNIARPADLLAAWQDNFAVIDTVARGARAERVAALSAAFVEAFRRLRARLASRRAAGYVRACHGDLHLGNLVLLEGRLTAFDCIEFNDEFRYIDTCNEIAFLFMDLERARRPRLARAFLDGYLQTSGDYAGLALLHLFAAYRASVRAKIALLRLAQQRSAGERRRSLAEADRYLAVAVRLLAAPAPGRLLLMHGLSGSGKSWLAAALAAETGCLCLRSDIERRRLYDIDTAAGRQAAYARVGVRRTYRALRRQAQHALAAGFDVIVDATFQAAAERRAFLDAASRLGSPVGIIAVSAPLAVLEERVMARARRGDDASQADLAVLRRQLARQQPLDARERSLAIDVRSDRAYRPAAIWRRLCKRLGARREDA